RPRDDRGHVPRRPDVRADLQPHDAAQSLDGNSAGDQGPDRPRCRSAAAPGGAVLMPETAGRGKQLDHGRNAMSRKRLSISIAAAALLRVGAVACSDGGTKTVTVGGGSTTPSGASDTTGGSSSGEKV